LIDGRRRRPSDSEYFREKQKVEKGREEKVRTSSASAQRPIVSSSSNGKLSSLLLRSV
jgi:hypothetical protein